MSCCGKKRADWLSNATDPSRYKKTNTVDLSKPHDNNPKIFEYTGNHNLELRGICTGKIYHFRFLGDIQEVDYMDSLAMMAERDLKIVKTTEKS